MVANISNIDPIKKDCSKEYNVETETRTFEIHATNMQRDGSFPHARRSKATSVEAVARQKQSASSLCFRCHHNIYHHEVNLTTFLMFLFEETIPASRLRDCSIIGCKCKGFVAGISPKDLKEETI